MLDKRCTPRDILRLERYQTILKICKKLSKIDDILDILPYYSGQMIRIDCRFLAKAGYMEISMIKCGKFNQETLHFKTLISKFNVAELVPVSVMINATKKINKLKATPPPEPNKPWIRTIIFTTNKMEEKLREQDKLFRLEKKSARVFVSGSTLSSSDW